MILNEEGSFTPALFAERGSAILASRDDVLAELPDFALAECGAEGPEDMDTEGPERVSAQGLEEERGREGEEAAEAAVPGARASTACIRKFWNSALHHLRPQPLVPRRSAQVVGAWRCALLLTLWY